MHLRRALLLFAIVLGLAAVAASVSRPRDSDSPPPTTSTQQPATIEPGTAPEAPPPGESGPGSVEVTFNADNPKAHRIAVRQAATVIVQVPEAGQVSIEDLGLTDAADPTTPASFDVLTTRPGRYAITFNPAATSESLDAGTLVVE